MVGWDAMVVTLDNADAGAAMILGARAWSLDAVLSGAAPSAGPGSGLGAVALSAGLYDRDPRVRRVVLDLLGTGRAEVRSWGHPRSAELEDAGEPVRYHLSTAARAFKAQALAALPPVLAARGPARLSPATETFWRVRLRERSVASVVPIAP
jgi:hypothetical protein